MPKTFEKPPTDKEIEREIISIHEEWDRKGRKPKEQNTENFQPEIKEDEELINKHNPKNKIHLNGEIEDFENWLEELENKIDNPAPPERNKQYGKNKNMKPPAIKKIIRKYSVPRNVWQKMNHKQKQELKAKIQHEIEEYYIKKH